jgi:hypothetical protein
VKPSKPVKEPKADNKKPANKPGKDAAQQGNKGRDSHAAVSGNVPGGRAPNVTAPLKGKPAAEAVDQLNRQRASMRGVNAIPLPKGDIAPGGNGHLVLKASGGREYGVRPDGSVSHFAAKGRSAAFSPHGGLRSIATKDMSMVRGPRGERRIETVRKGVTVVSLGSRRGYVARNVTLGGRSFVQRTYVANNVVYTRIYAPYQYHGTVMAAYVPVVRFSPGFAVWASSPWDSRVSFGWGWSSDPWFGFYRGYFAPEAYYASPSLWLTDYLLAQNLRTAYQAQGDGPAEEASTSEAAPAAPITPEIKSLIATQVVEHEKAIAQAGPSGEPDDARVPLTDRRVFIVSDPLNVAAGDRECGLTAGDIIRLSSSMSGEQLVAPVEVLSAKPMDCAAGVTVTVAVKDLQDMHNQFLEQTDAALGALAERQGKDGLPPSPPSGLALANVRPAPDKTAEKLLSEERATASRQEAEVLKAAFPDR